MDSRLQDLVAEALGPESTELARIYVGEGALATMAETAEVLAQAQLKSNDPAGGVQTMDFRRAFAQHLQLLLALAGGGDASSPKTKE